MFNQIDELKQVIEKLKSENEELKSKLADYQTKKNSNNSSKPPLSDFSNLKKTKSLKKKSVKKIGGQSGHKGSSMKMVPKGLSEISKSNKKSVDFLKQIMVLQTI